MNNFEFYNPVKILFGKDQVSNLPVLLQGKKRIMITYGGGSIKKNGILDQVKKQLKDFSLIEFQGIMPNPQYDKLTEAITLAKEENIDFILAIGGGSVIDATKFIAAGIHHPTDPWGILSKREPIHDVTPFGTILTLPATGSEMNSFSVISKGEEKLGFGGDPRLFAKFSILDPCYTYSLPKKQLSNGIVDAFVHVLEQYLTKNINTPIQDQFAVGILRTLIKIAPKVMADEPDYDSRANLMWSATQALNGLIGSGVVHDWSTHMIGHEITALYGVDHARSLAIVLPSLLRHQKINKKEKLIHYAEQVWGLSGEDNDIIETAIIKTENFFKSLNVPIKLVEYDIQESNISDIVKSLKKHIPVNIGENKDIDADLTTSILKGALK